MKRTILISALVLLATSVFSQVTLYSNNFDSYTVGNKLALVAGGPWTTWSNAPGGAEDGTISATQSHSPSNSCYIVTNNDLVYRFYDKTAGRYNMEWWMYVESGKYGYFNVLSEFNGNNSEWAFQVYNYHDSIFIDAGGTTAAKTTFASNTWKKINLIVDLDDDFATFYIDGTEIISYQWSKGAQGTGVAKKLDGIDFYGWDGTGGPGTGTAGYYIDDFKVDSCVAPNAPSNLTAVQNGANIDVTWTAPAPAPDLYKLSRNGAVVFTSASALTYTDNSPWPNTYVYGVRAHYAGQGYSHSSNTDTVTIAGGVARNLVLMEGGTGTWCGYCPGAAMGLRDLIEVNNKDAAAIEYHSGDGYENTASAARVTYYNITGFPTVYADGVLKVVGGNATTSMYSSYLPMYNQRITQPAFYNINANVVMTSTDNFSATITVEQTYAPYGSGMKLHAALTESNIPETWGNQTEVDFALRAMYPNENGTNLTFATNPQTVNFNFTTTGFVKNNCELVLFVQHDASKEVFQTMMIDMSSIVGMEELEGRSIKLYPNPAQGFFTLNSAGNGTMSLTDMTGKQLMRENISYTTQSFDISRLAKGVYFVNVSTERSSFTQKLVVE